MSGVQKRIVLMLTVGFVVGVAYAGGPENTQQADDMSGKHLFILSGQSNI